MSESVAFVRSEEQDGTVPVTVKGQWGIGST
jgi:hypothetical protein